jgi:hypothetical protein
LRDDFRRKHVCERQTSVLKKLTSQKPHLPLKRPLCKMPHPWASLPVMGVLAKPIYAREALLPMSVGPKAVRKI